MNIRCIQTYRKNIQKYNAKKSILDLLFKNQFISLHPLLERRCWLKGRKEIVYPVWEVGKREREEKAGKNYLDFFWKG